ncbi:MAG: hydrogenase expression/formation protein HypE [Lachnospiraceae bacterium]|nr:hydrogenase expression/formation protein HypE [Lachnospiraceae bacterium]
MEDTITLDFGSGGKKTSALIEELILPLLSNEALDELDDGAVLAGNEKLVFSTDSFVVDPYFFPGGDIGKLAVCGTVNDLAVSGGEPKYLSLGLILEEGFPRKDLERILSSVARTAKEAGVMVVTGDTKVVERGKGDGIYINTSGIGFLRAPWLSRKAIREGDAVLISGTIGCHGTAVMLARNENLVEGNVLSDCGPVHRLAGKLLELGEDLHFMRDPTRGGAATTLCEFVEGTDLSIELDEKSLPLDPAAAGACEILGLDPLYSASEGRLLCVLAKERAGEALALLKSLPEGEGAALIGRVTRRSPGKVIIRTAFGGARIAARLAGAQLPRIC